MNLANGGHLGDAMWSALLFQKIPGPHAFSVKAEYHAQLAELFAGTDITLHGTEPPAEGSRDTWIANGSHVASGVHWSGQQDILAFVRDYMNAEARANGFGDVLQSREDMLFSFPAIRKTAAPSNPFDILVVNCDPLSGQCPHYSRSEVDGLLLQLQSKGHRLLCTNGTSVAPWASYTLAQIGNLSLRAKAILCVASGPAWATFNIWNKHVPHYVWLDPMRLDYGPEVKIRHAQNAEQTRIQLLEDGWL